MTTARVNIDDTSTVVVVDAAGDTPGGRYVIPAGIDSLRRSHFTNDPPAPEDLTNAIGEMLDHLADARRETPALVEATTVVVSGPGPRAIAFVEFGGVVDAPTHVLTREATEEVFRILATENASERRLNPGLPAGFVDSIVAGCCALVALMRGLHLGALIVDLAPQDAAAISTE